MNIVITGCFTQQAIGHYGRTKVRAFIMKAGHNVRSELSSKTDYLVIGTAVPGRPPGPSKLNQAKALGVKIITLTELQALLAA